jgi:3-oxoacyl-[acyl-carrier-protein] synthase III
MRTKILGTGSYLPPKVVTNADFEKIVETTDQWIVDRTGIKERRIVEKGTWLSDLAIEAGKNALDSANTDPSEIDLVILTTSTPDQPLPPTAVRVQEKLGIKNGGAFDLAATCSGWLYGVSLADQCIQTGFCKKILLIGAEIMTSTLDFTDRSTCILFGDGAGATVLGVSDDESGFYSHQLYAAGEFAKVVEIPGGGVMNPPSHENIEANLNVVKMKGKELFKEAVPRLISSSKAALEANHLTVDDVTMYLPHQANIRMISAVAKRLKLPMERVFINLDRVGNTGSASLPIALDEIYRGKQLKKDQWLLFSTVGAGLTYGASVYKW